jgi:hypothetical protein
MPDSTSLEVLSETLQSAVPSPASLLEPDCSIREWFGLECESRLAT